MRPLVIGPEERKALQSLKTYAEKNPYSTDDVLDLLNGEMIPAGDSPEFTRIIPFDFKVVFTIEAQKKGPARHLSKSVPTPGRSASPAAVQMIMDELGFEKKLKECHVWVEADIVNVIEYL